MKEVPVPHRSEGSHDSVASSVLDRARNGDNDAFARIFNLYAGLVFHWCRKSGIAEADAGQVSQEVFLAVSRGLKGFKREKPGDSFKAWLRVVTKSRIADYFRQAPREVGVGGDDNWLLHVSSPETTESTAEDRIETNLVYERATRLIESEFSARDCSAFKLSVIEGLTGEEVARQLEITPNSVYIARCRILKRLRDEFGDVMDLEQ